MQPTAHPPEDRASSDDPVVDLVAQALDALEEGGEEGLEAFCRAHPAEADVIRRRVALLGEHGLRAKAESAAELALGEELGDFRLVRPIGGGGMGVVWLAEQRSLGREVALKIVRPDQLFFDSGRERFRREVATIARLQHPGIVPVYAVGEERGLPYFAMERVRGLSLCEVLQALAERESRTLTGRDLAALLPAVDGVENGGDNGGGSDGKGDGAGSTLFDGPWPEVALRIVREVAEALEHARRRGIVHRDIKPSNVMITRGGRVQLVDFGLAWRAGDARITRTGTAVGSLAYLPPEALGGGGDAQDPRQDVYSLGATLYEMIALRPPFAAKSHAALVRAIAEGNPPSLRTVRPDVSWEIATIVAVAMERDPARRYPHAGALARDLENALERRPIEARPPGAWLRAKRWVQRRPALAVSLAALVLAPSALLLREWRSRRIVEAKNAEIGAANLALGQTNKLLETTNAELEQALVVAREQRALAQESFSHALDAVDRMLLRVGQDRIAGEPRMEGIQRELVADALELYGWFLARGENDAGLVRQVARVALTAGNLHEMLGQLDEAEAALERSHGLLEELLAEDPDDVKATLLLAQADDRLATVQRRTSRDEEAQESARAAIDALEALDPEELDADTRVERGHQLGLAWTTAGLQREQDGDLQGALEALTHAVDLLRATPVEGPRVDSMQVALARSLDHRGRIRGLAAAPIGGVHDSAELKRALADLEEASRMFDEIVARNPGLPEPRFRRARVLLNQMGVRADLGLDPRVLAVGLEALRAYEELVADFPSVPTYRADLASTIVNVAAFHARAGDNATSKTVLERGLVALDAALERSPEDAELRQACATALQNLGALLQAEGDLESALDALQAATVHVDAALAAQPDDRRVRGTSWWIAYNRGKVLLGLGRPGEALEAAEALLEGGPGMDEIETYAVLAQGALAAAEPEVRGGLLESAAGKIALLLAGGTLEEGLLESNPSLSALAKVEGFAEALERAREP